MSSKNMTTEEAYEIAQRFRNLSEAVAKFLLERWHDLSPEQREKLEKLETRLRNYATSFVAKGIKDALDKVDNSVNRIKRTTARMGNTIKKLKDVKKAITVATAAVTLGAGIYSGNPQAIASGIQGAIDSLS